MTQFDSNADLSLSRLEDSHLLSLSSDVLEHPEFRVVTESDAWLNTAYDLLAEQFQPDVLDPLERYVDWLELNRIKKHPFPYLMMVSYCRVQGRALLLGVVSGNIMKVEKYVGANPGEKENLYIFAIGHQVTEPALRQSGVKGIGSKLWKSSMEEATAWIKEFGGRLCYSVLEAEADSVGFWTKLGYLWPKDVRYWQPPLEFDDAGQYLQKEVEETLMLRPMETSFQNKIPKNLLQNIIATMYLNWSLAKYRTTLAPAAMKRAEDYVMGNVFKRVCNTMPASESMLLVARHG